MMYTASARQLNVSSRLDVVDALRGFALLAIVLLHNLEHYNIYWQPDMLPAWLKALDGYAWNTVFFLMAGKAYAMFSLLFGFSFYIQFRNAQKRGEDFRLRFAWRLALLFLFAQLHALFYNGDILVLYSVVGFVLIPVCKLRDKTVLIIAAVLMLQPFEWANILYAMSHPDYHYVKDCFAQFAENAGAVDKFGTFGEVLRDNIWNGQLYSNIWQVEAGRVFQSAALFMFGMLLGRRELFVRSETSRRTWRKILCISAIAFVPFYLLRLYVPDSVENPAIRASWNVIFSTWSNFAFMFALVAGFSLLWFRRGNGFALQRIPIAYGRMSLTNYIAQSIIGVTIYYGYGLGLYKYTGATFTLLIGLGIFALQLVFSRWWLARHRNGPLEFLWRKATWLWK